MIRRSRFAPLLVLLPAAVFSAAESAAEPPYPADLITDTMRGRWSEDRANDWYANQPWPVGANYVPRNAINQLEMWQPETFSPELIDEELGWAQALGMNTMRVYLHDLLWRQDADGFIDRIEAFLRIAQKRGIRPMFVFFDGVWDPDPYLGPQRPPRPHTHNSGWIQSPGRTILGDRSSHDSLKPYVKGVLSHFRQDRRILAWDLFNEPDNGNRRPYGSLELPDKDQAAHALLIKAFEWAREVNPRQPITAGIWKGSQGWEAPTPMHKFMLANSDIITFHNYADAEDMRKEVEGIRSVHDRPLLCTEYMARGHGSTFDPIMGYLKRKKVGAYSWGLVDGKSQTKYPWATWAEVFTAEPEVWHHDIFRADGTPYRQDEIDYIRGVTGADR